MIIKLISDVHLEMYHKKDALDFCNKLPNKNIDVLVMAGDICLAKNNLDAVKLLCDRFPDVVWVFGNHEYYSADFEHIQRVASRLEIGNLHYLENSLVEIKGKRFLGSTLWYRYTPESSLYERYMNDFHVIHHHRKFNRFIYNYANTCKNWLLSNVQQGDIVVTHMLPTEKCVDFQFHGQPTNCFYVHPCDNILTEKKPAIWMHGHSHNHFDKVIEKTRVVRNPRGYPDEFKTGFRDQFYIVVD